MKARHGSLQAVCIVAHKLARIVYTLLKTRRPYRDDGAAAFEHQYRQRKLASLQRQASKLGLKLVEDALEPAQSGAVT